MRKIVNPESKKLTLFNIDIDNYKKFKLMALKSDLSMTDIVNDLIAQSIKNETYSLKNVIKK